MGLADLDIDVLVTSGRRGVVDVGVPPPANTRVVDLVDFTTTLPRAAVFVTNGGWGGVLAGLGAGVPLVLAARGAADKSTSPPGWRVRVPVSTCMPAARNPVRSRRPYAKC